MSFDFRLGVCGGRLGGGDCGFVIELIDDFIEDFVAGLVAIDFD